MSDVDVAVGLFTGGCACSQAVLGAYCGRYGLDQNQAMRVSAAFAGGMRMAETCGAVSGALMVLGLAHCDDSCRTADGRKRAYAEVIAFTRAFREREGALDCRDLLGCDTSTPEGAKQAAEQGLFRTKCPQLVRTAAELLEEVLPKR